MPSNFVSEAERRPRVHLPVARARGLTRALAWSAPAAVLSIASVLVYVELDFSPSGISNRLVDYGLALCVLPFGVFGIYCAYQAIRWLLLFVWPGTLGVFADEDALVLRLGSFGVRYYEASDIDVRYPFELDSDLEDGGFEAFLPEEQQRDTLLPRIAHPKAAGPINIDILRFTGVSEVEAARTLRPVIDSWQASVLHRQEQAKGE